MSATRGRPRGFNRCVALRAAMNIFWQKGFSAASMADLCGAMAINSPSLYAAFGSKEELYEEALRHYAMTTGSPIWTIIEPAKRAREAIEGLLMNSAAAYATSGKPRGCMVTLSTVGNEGQPRLGSIVAEMNATMLAMIEARLAKASEEGEIPASIDVKAIARLYRGVQQGMAVQARNGATREELESFARAALAGWPALMKTGWALPPNRATKSEDSAKRQSVATKPMVRRRIG